MCNSAAEAHGHAEGIVWVCHWCYAPEVGEGGVAVVGVGDVGVDVAGCGHFEHALALKHEQEHELELELEQELEQQWEPEYAPAVGVESSWVAEWESTAARGNFAPGQTRPTRPALARPKDACLLAAGFVDAPTR